MSHDDSTGEEGNDTWKSKNLTYQIRNISDQQDKTGFLDGVSVERLIDFEQVAQAESKDSSNG